MPVALLIHGLTNDSSTWWRVKPELERRGYTVVTPDLPGHGDGVRRDGYTLGDLVSAVVDAVPEPPELALGHSLGGFVLAHALSELRPARAVFEDPPLALSADAVVLESFRAQATFTVDDVRALYPAWPDEAITNKHRALGKWDPSILDDLGSFPAPSWGALTVPSSFVLADGSPLVPSAKADELRALGYTVTTVARAGHIVHADEFDGFIDALDLESEG